VDPQVEGVKSWDERYKLRDVGWLREICARLRQRLADE
jgi:hypothetical protein